MSTYVFVWLIGFLFAAGLIVSEPGKPSVKEQLFSVVLAFTVWPMVIGEHTGHYFRRGKRK